MSDDVDAGLGEDVFGDGDGDTQEENGFTSLSGDDSMLGHVASEDSTAEDPEIEAIKARVKEMEEEANKLKEMQSEVERQMSMSSPNSSLSNVTSPVASDVDKAAVDSRSIYVGNVDYSANAEELEQHFHGCGSINRVTILCDKFTGNPKGFAYIEFADKDSVTTAQALDESLFKGRQIKVNAKRTNIHGISSTDRTPRRRFGGRGRGRSFGGFYNPYATSSRARPYIPGYRRRARWFSPY